MATASSLPTTMFPPFFDAGDKRLVTLSALAGVLLVVSVTWKVQKWIGHASASEGHSPSAANHTTNKHAAEGQRESSPGAPEKHHSSSEHDHDHDQHLHLHHRHAKSLSPSGHEHSHDEHKDREHPKHARAQSQPIHSEDAHYNHEHSSQSLPLHDAHDEPTLISHARHYSETGSARKRYDYSGLSGSRDDAHRSHGDRPSHSTDHTLTEHVSADDFRERLQRHIEEYFARHPEAITYWEDETRVIDGLTAPGGIVPAPPGKRYRELALSEARLRKEAFENSKRAFKMGRKAEAKQLSDAGKLHDENARRYNALAAQEIFAAYNPRYGSDRLSKCDLHGLHVEEATEYARNHLVNCQRMGVDKTMLIVGKGAHSQQGGARIKPAIMAMLSDTGGVVAGVHEKNEGCIVVEFAVYRR